MKTRRLQMRPVSMAQMAKIDAIVVDGLPIVDDGSFRAGRRLLRSHV